MIFLNLNIVVAHLKRQMSQVEPWQNNMTFTLLEVKERVFIAFNYAEGICKPKWERA